MLGYSDNQWNRRKVAFLIRMATDPNGMWSDMVSLNAHFEVFGIALELKDIPKAIRELADRQESILECYEATDDESERAKYRAMGALLGTLRQELKIKYLESKRKGR